MGTNNFYQRGEIIVAMVANDQIELQWRENADLNGIAEKTIGGNTRFCRKPCLKSSRVSPNSFISRLNRLFLLLITILLFHQWPGINCRQFPEIRRTDGPMDCPLCMVV